MTVFINENKGTQVHEHSSHDKDAVVAEWSVKWTKMLDQFH